MNITFGEDCFESLFKLLEEDYRYSKIFVLTDSNTLNFCLPVLMEQCAGLEDIEILEVAPGEPSKDLEIVARLWETLLEMHADRNTLLLNLGGGVITDLGGFVAATFKRGIDFINIPTSLLGMTDAAYGGKTGINFGGLKNQVGTFTDPVAIFYYPPFLATLPNEHLRAGTAEMLKHGLIANAGLFFEMQKAISGKEHDFDALLKISIQVKREIVEKDRLESQLRKHLNFGHTVGHAFESLYGQKNLTLLHGDAVAAGMIVESYLSYKHFELTQEELENITQLLFKNFPKIQFEPIDIPLLLNFVHHDKKINDGQLELPLLSRIGSCELKKTLSDKDLSAALLYYLELT